MPVNLDKVAHWKTDIALSVDRYNDWFMPNIPPGGEGTTFDTRLRLPARFLLNHSQATATNVFLRLSPQPALARQLARNPSILRILWEALNAIRPEALMGEGWVYGSGLHKLEPKELANVPADDLALLAGLTTTPTTELPWM